MSESEVKDLDDKYDPESGLESAEAPDPDSAETTDLVELDLNSQPAFDPTKIDVITQSRTIDALLGRLKHGEMDLSPDFQRSANLWNAERKTSLIESILLRIPIPSLYVSEDENGDYAVVDGLQRMSAVAHFVDVESLNKATDGDLEQLKLNKKGLRSFQNLAGLSFSELERPLQRRIMETELIIHVIRFGTPSEVKFNIFSRLNQGGLPLNAQEIRNAIYPGVWRNKIRKIAESSAFIEATEGKIPTKRMEDLELVLRSVALYEQDQPRRNDQNLENYLNNFVEEHCQLWTDEKWNNVSKKITDSLKSAHKIFGDYVFRKYYRDGEQRKPINRGLFEAQLSVLARYDDDTRLLLESRKAAVFREYIRLSDFTAYCHIYEDTDDPLFDVAVSKLLEPSEVEDVRREFDKGINIATSKGLASNQRIAATKFIYETALTTSEEQVADDLFGESST